MTELFSGLTLNPRRPESTFTKNCCRTDFTSTFHFFDFPSSPLGGISRKSRADRSFQGKEMEHEGRQPK